MIQIDKDRINRLRNILTEKDLDGILISQPENIYYLSGFRSTEGWLLVTQQHSMIAVDFRYIEQAKSEAPDFEHIMIRGDVANWLPALTNNFHISKLGIESDYLTVTQFLRIQNTLKSNDAIIIVPCTNIVENLRTVKKADEIKLIEEASELTGKCLEYGLTILKPGITEIQCAWQLEKFLRDNGSEQLPFDIIVASGIHSAWPHARPTDKEISRDEPITIDIGARINSYCCDISRTYCIGSNNRQYNKIYDVVLAAQQAACAMITAGMTGQQADQIARTIITEAGYGDKFGHGLGHGFGLAVHELPRLGTSSNDILSESMVFTIEPGIYIEGWGGVRIEDSVTIQKGRVSIISKCPKISNI
jgi:Xaa-Pro aminopeptidase